MTSYQGGSADVSRVSAADGWRRDGGMAAGLAVPTTTPDNTREDTDR